MKVDSHAGYTAARLEESETAETGAFAVLGDTHERAEEANSELQRSGFASSLSEFGQQVTFREARNHITTPMRPSQLPLDICDQRFMCRMAKKLGCQFCAKKSL